MIQAFQIYLQLSLTPPLSARSPNVVGPKMLLQFLLITNQAQAKTSVRLTQGVTATRKLSRGKIIKKNDGFFRTLLHITLKLKVVKTVPTCLWTLLAQPAVRSSHGQTRAVANFTLR